MTTAVVMLSALDDHQLTAELDHQLRDARTHEIRLEPITVRTIGARFVPCVGALLRAGWHHAKIETADDGGVWVKAWLDPL